MRMLTVALGRSVVVMVLVISSLVIGIPVPASAAGQCGGQLTMEGRPLSGRVRLTTGASEGLTDSEAADSGRRAGPANRPAHTESIGDRAESVVGQAAPGSLWYPRRRRSGCWYRSCDSRGGGSFRRTLRRGGCGNRGRAGRKPMSGLRH
jgi:hypothetical protein